MIEDAGRYSDFKLYSVYMVRTWYRVTLSLHYTNEQHGKGRNKKREVYGPLIGTDTVLNVHLQQLSEENESR